MTYAIEAFSIEKKIGVSAILPNILLFIPCGVICGFLGAGGTRKISFLKILMGLWMTDSRTIQSLDKELRGEDGSHHWESKPDIPKMFRTPATAAIGFGEVERL